MVEDTEFRLENPIWRVQKKLGILRSGATFVFASRLCKILPGNLTMQINFITTGGTIDKVYFDAKSSYEVGEPQIGRILDAIGAAIDYRVISLLRKDSLELTDADRALIHATVLAQDSQRIIITHGTDSMVETALALDGIPDKTIVLTGALNPARFADSDAVFNIGCAIGAVQGKAPGVYVAMNGRVWDPDKVRKNRAANRFEPVV